MSAVHKVRLVQQPRSIIIPDGADDARRRPEPDMAKARRTAPELQKAIMLEVRRHPEWNDILGVTITERHRAAPPHPNWIAVFTMSGPRIAPERAFRLIVHLQNEFDLG
jgi:hypothetical protein